MLEAHGAVTRAAPHPRAALGITRQAALCGEPFDAIVLDLTAVGDTTGPGPHRTREPFGVQTVVLASLRTHPSATSGMHDVVTVLPKPLKERQLVAAVVAAVDRTRAVDRAS